MNLNPLLAVGGSVAGGALGVVNPVAGSAVQGVGQYFQNQFNFENQKELQDRNFDFQRSEREAAQEYNTTMWNAQNAYNSIGAQIERGRAAGVNPNAIIGGVTGNLASGAPTISGASGGTAAAPQLNMQNTIAENITTGMLEEALEQAANKTLRDKYEYIIFVDKTQKELNVLDKQLEILAKEYDIKNQTFENLKISGNYDKLKYEFAKALGVPLEADEVDKLLYDFSTGGLEKVIKRLAYMTASDMTESVDDAIGKIYEDLTSFLPTNLAQKTINIIKNVYGNRNVVK